MKLKQKRIHKESGQSGLPPDLRLITNSEP